MIIRSDGFVGIVHDNKKEALDWINIIFGVAYLIKESPCHVVREIELCEIEVDSKTGDIVTETDPMNSLRIYQSSTYFGYQHPNELRKRKLVNVENIKEIIEIAEQITADKELSNELIFLLEGFTHYTESEYPQAFITAWVIVEKYISYIWSSFIKEKGISKKRKKKLTNSLLWHTDHILESLNIAGKIDDQTYETLMNLKSKRNKFVHEGKAIEKEDAEKVLTLAIQILRNKIQEKIGSAIRMSKGEELG